MDRLDNEDIGMIWARHFPKRAESGSSRSLCLSLAMVLRLRARSTSISSCRRPQEVSPGSWQCFNGDMRSALIFLYRPRNVRPVHVG